MDFYLSAQETIIVIILCSIFFLSTRFIKLSNTLTFIHPIFIYSSILFYYSILSPLSRIAFGSLIYKGLNFRNLLIYGWMGALISTLFIYLGYFLAGEKKDLIKKQVSKISNKRILILGIFLCLIGYLSYQISAGYRISNFNPFINEEDIFLEFLTYKGSLVNYLYFSQDFLISGNLLLLIAMLNNKNLKLIFFFNLILTSGLYLNGGFRYRIFFLSFTLLFYYLIYSRKNNKFIAKSTSVGFVSLIFLNTLLETVRVYGKGFNLEKLKYYNFSDLIISILVNTESSVFLTTSAVIKYVPTYYSYINLYPFYKLIIHPIPSSFFEKNSGDYVNDLLSQIYGSEIVSAGAAYHNFAEYYLMGGWLTLIILSLILGIIFKKLWIWGNLHKNEPLGLAVYIINISFTFMLISRGYLSQQGQIYIFSILPINIIYFLNSKLIKGIK